MTFNQPQPKPGRVFLSPPTVSDEDISQVETALKSGWIAPVGPALDQFEYEFANLVGSKFAVGVSSGTAALHLALLVAGIGSNDEVIVSTFTFCASINPIIYTGASPILMDSELKSWNVDPNILESFLVKRASQNRLPKAIIIVHIYGQTANMSAISAICDRFGILIIEDAAEALGATHSGCYAGTIGEFGIFSFNGNKIISTSGGGMLICKSAKFAEQTRKLATQARDTASYYVHSEIGYNYRLSNILAALGCAQLSSLQSRLDERHRIFLGYQESLTGTRGLSFMPDAGWGYHSRWLSCITVDRSLSLAEPEDIRLSLETENIESRRLWNPMHMQPAYRRFETVLTGVAESLFETGLCLPSGGGLSVENQDRIVSTIKSCINER